MQHRTSAKSARSSTKSSAIAGRRGPLALIERGSEIDYLGRRGHITEPATLPGSVLVRFDGTRRIEAIDLPSPSLAE